MTLRNRIEWSQYGQDSGTTSGYLLYQDVDSHKPPRILRNAAAFQLNTYNTRIYAYENDLLYAYSIANIYVVEGQRVYAMVQYSPCGAGSIPGSNMVRPFYTDRDTLAAEMKPLKETEGQNFAWVRFKW